MTTIQKDSEYATLINVFTVEPSRAGELVRLLATVTEDVIRHLRGFMSANIHLRVVNYAQWESADDMEKCAALATSSDPHLYTVESVHQRQGV